MLDFYPYKFPDPLKESDSLKKLLDKDTKIQESLNGLKQETLTEEMKKIIDTLQERKMKQHQRFEGWRFLQDKISANFSCIEFRRAGAITYNLFDKTLGTEKSVDVKLATDMIMLRDIYDVAMIVSGDQDYVPAVQVVKDSGKHVVNVSFLTRGGKQLPGGARRLNQITDWSIDIQYNEFAEHLKVPTISG